MSDAHDFPDFHMPAPLTSTPDPASCGTDVLETGAAWHNAMFKGNASHPIIYTRGVDQVALCATFGQKLFKLDDGEGGFVIEYSDRDFIVSAADLTIDDEPIEPRREDRVTVVKGGVARTYEVGAPGGEPPWRWCDRHRIRMRIHAKLIAEEEV